jgi:tetratricopeptide (TPR) repeat protein
VSSGRRWLFRLGAMTLVPLLVLGGLELGLRLAGYGYPTSYFVPAHIEGRDYFVPNPQFSLRFFPPALARNPLPLRLAAEKPAGTYRIFLFGESAAQGDPDPTFGVGRYLEVLLRERYPGANFEVVCASMTAINSHVILPIARECARHQGDLWLIYMGNNEIVGPYGAGTIFGPQAPSLPLIRVSLALRATRLGQLIDAAAARLRRGDSEHKSWGGMKMFTEHQVRYGDAARLRVYSHFRKNLDDILRAGTGAGVPIILSTVASNLKDCAPFASLHAVNVGETQAAAFEEVYYKAKAAEAAGACQEALGLYQQSVELDPEFADAHYRLGTCLLAQTNFAQARREFELARDYDTLGFRADTRINEVIKGAAARQSARGVHLADAVSILATNSAGSIPGQDVFYEHVHLHFGGNYLLARAFADQVASLLPPSLTARDKKTWAEAAFCDRRLGVTVWDRYRLWKANYRRLFEPPFVNQSDHPLRVKSYQARLDEIEASMNQESPEQARAIYQEAVAAAPDDYFLHGNFSEFLESRGDWAAAQKEQQRVCELLPTEPVPYFKIGRLLLLQGKAQEARDSFTRALAIRPNFPQALNELGLLLAHQQKPAEAEQYFTRAVQANPDYAETYINLGFMKQNDGKLNEAMAQYQTAANLEVEGPAAYFSQGVALAVQHRRAEAIEAFRQAAQLRTGFWQATYLMGVELAGQEKVAEAREQFEQTVRLRPDFAKAHMNLGVALAKQAKFDQALAEFRATLQLNPTNKLAQQHIDMIAALKHQAL